MSKVIVIGANHAGTAAINTLLSQDPKPQVVVFDKNSNISFLGCGMALWIGNQISSSDGLFYSSKALLEEKGATVHMEAEVTAIDFKEKTVAVNLADGSSVNEPYDKLIIATGSAPIIPNVPGVDLENVQLVKLFQNAQEVIEKLKNPEIQNISVIGAGYIGVELAEAFKLHGKNVSLFDVMPHCLSSYYDEPFSIAMDDVMRNRGISLHYGEKLLEIQGNQKVQSIVTDKGEYPTDMVILCVGFRPNIQLGNEKLAQFRNGAYLVNKRQETSIMDVYAIGDCATVYNNATDSSDYIALATNAVRSGIVAAYNACGVDVESIGVQGSNGICIFDYKMVSTGVSVARAANLNMDVAYVDFEDLQKPEFIETENPTVKLRIVYDKASRVVVGAQMASYYDMSMGIHMFSLAIQEKVTIDKLKLLDIFFLPHFNKPYNYLTMAALNAQ